MEYFRPDVKVGAFICVALVLLVIAAFTIGGVGDWFAPTQQYTVLFSNANLLRRRAKVSYAGSLVGEVTAIMVHSNAAWQQAHPGYPVAITIVVHEEMALREDVRVELRTDGFIGERYLDIVPGSGPPLPARQCHPRGYWRRRRHSCLPLRAWGRLRGVERGAARSHGSRR